MQSIPTWVGVRTVDQEESLQLHLVKDWCNQYSSYRGRYADLLTTAFLHSDRFNFDLLIPAIDALIEHSPTEFTCTCSRAMKLYRYYPEQEPKNP